MLNDRLIYAAANGRLSEVEALIKADNINLTDQNGATALMWAAEKGNEGIATLLLEAGAKVDLTYKDGATALTLAAEYGHKGIVALLLGAGANVDLACKDGWTALMWAAHKGHKGIVTLLLKASADANLANKNGSTALMWAAQKGYEGIATLLLEAGAKVDLTYKDGATALTLAAEHGHQRIVARLLKAGANLHHAKNNHDTAMSLAAKNKHSSVVIALIEAGGFDPSPFKDRPLSLKFTQKLVLPMTKNKLDEVFELSSNPDRVNTLIQSINTLTETLKGDHGNSERNEVRNHLIQLIKEDTKKLASGKLPADFQAYLDSLKCIENNLHLIQPNPKEKAAATEIKSLIAKAEALAAEHKPLVAGSITSKIQLCLSSASKSYGFKLVQFKKDLKMELSALAKPNAAEIEELRKTVIKLTTDERKYLREALKELFDEAIIELNKGKPDQWILDLQKNHHESKSSGKDIPFIAILRVSESGKKPDHNTDTWGHVIKKMTYIEPSSNSKVSSISRFRQDKKDEAGQTSHARLNKYKPGNNDL